MASRLERLCKSVRTDNRDTMDGTGGDGAENVVRLPRDWVGPPEELVPMGSRARAREAEEPTGADTAQAADDFWGGGGGAIQSAIQPSTRLAEPPASHPASAEPPRRRVRTRGRRLRLRPRAVVIALAVCCVAGIAALGFAEDGGRPAAAGRGMHMVVAAGGSSDVRQLGPTAGDLPLTASDRPAHVPRVDRRNIGSHPRATARAKALRARARHRRLARGDATRDRRHHQPRTHHPVVTSSSSGTEATAPTATATSPSPAPTTTTPSATSASSAGSGSSTTHTTSTHTHAFGPGGVLGAGHQG